tara:strand:- start:305 stop:484 length:180 start_codon:yes stop_codon:yes gene_type:complete
MKLSDQALGALMMALQKALMEQSDITETLRSFDFIITGPSQSELVVANPPLVEIKNEDA